MAALDGAWAPTPWPGSACCYRAALALLLACGPPGPLRTASGCPATGSEQYALVFEHTGGLVSGTMHHLVEGRQTGQWGFAGTRTGAGELELSWGREQLDDRHA